MRRPLWTGRFFLEGSTLFGLVVLVLVAAISVSSTAFAASYSSSSPLASSRTQQSGNTHSATAGLSHYSVGKGKGTSHLPSLSAQQLAIHEKMLAFMHPALPTVPVASTTSTNRIQPGSVAPSQVQLSYASTTPRAAVSTKVYDLGTQSSATVDEPSVASDGVNVLQTWNWYSGISTAGGQYWTYYNPATLFPNDYGGWCCDSVATYNSGRNIFIWTLLYLPNASGGALRLAVADGGSQLAGATFHYWDLTPQQVGGPSGDWYDYPVISYSNNYAYLQTNEFHADNTFNQTIVMRFSLSALTGTGGLSYSYLSPPGVVGVTFTNGATTTMYFAGHLSTSTLRVFNWAENSNTVYQNDINHVSFPSGAFSCPRTGAANSNWCGRSDSRLLGGWVSNGVIGFNWNAPQGKWGFSGSAPYPYTDVVRINQNAMTHINDPVIWNPSYAFMYMSYYPNSSGGLGSTFLYGGGSLYEDGGASIWDSQGRNFVGLISSNADATNGGDYLTNRSLGSSWVGTNYSVRTDGIHTYNITFTR